MGSRKFYRDGLEELIIGPILVKESRDGHVVERYKRSDGKKRYFVTLAGTHFCAHGNTLAQAIADALWKDPTKRPSMESLVESIRKEGVSRKLSLNEFRILTGACSVGCREALKKVGRDESPLTAKEIRDHISQEWGNKLISILKWEKVIS